MAACPTVLNGLFKFCLSEDIFHIIDDPTKGNDHKWAALQTSTALHLNEENPRYLILLEFFYQNIQ